MEFEIIVEFSFNPKQECLVFRFLDGKSYYLNIKDLPKKLQTKKPEWESCYLSANKTCLIFHAGKEIREIPAFIIHSKGNEM